MELFFKIIKLFLLFINISILIGNILKLIKKNKILINNLIVFKHSDYFFLNIFKLTYKDISNYLNILYNINNNKSNNLNFSYKKKIIKLYCLDLFDKKRHKIWLEEKLENKFIIKYDSENPDYLIYNVFGNRHLNKKYQNALKISIYTENKIPDLNKSDYVIGHPHINYLDRYFKYSVFLWENFTDLTKIRNKILKNPLKKKFCAAVISNTKKIDSFRIKFINELNKYKLIDMGGKYKNNIGGNVKDKIKFLTNYKFSISMENSMTDGYITEKIIQSFRAGTIPIYYGDYIADEYINPKSFILIKGSKDMKKKIDYIKKIDNDDKLYKKLIKENILIDNNFLYKIDKELKDFLQHIFEQDKIKAYRLNK